MKLKQNSELKDFNLVTPSEYQSLASCDMLKFSYPFVAGDNYEYDQKIYRLLQDCIDALKLAITEPDKWDDHCERKLSELHAQWSNSYRANKTQRIALFLGQRPVENMDISEFALSAFALAGEVLWTGYMDDLVKAMCERLGVTVESLTHKEVAQ